METSRLPIPRGFFSYDYRSGSLLVVFDCKEYREELDESDLNFLPELVLEDAASNPLPKVRILLEMSKNLIKNIVNNDSNDDTNLTENV